METLRRAIDRGYTDVPNMPRDPDLDALRSRADSKSLLAELQAKAQAQAPVCVPRRPYECPPSPHEGCIQPSLKRRARADRLK